MNPKLQIEKEIYNVNKNLRTVWREMYGLEKKNLNLRAQKREHDGNAIGI